MVEVLSGHRVITPDPASLQDGIAASEEFGVFAEQAWAIPPIRRLGGAPKIDCFLLKATDDAVQNSNREVFVRWISVSGCAAIVQLRRRVLFGATQ